MHFATAGVLASVAVSIVACTAKPEQDAVPPFAAAEKVVELLDTHKRPDMTWSEIYERYAELIQFLDNDPERVLNQLLAYAHQVPHDEDAMARAWNSTIAIQSLYSPYASHRVLLMERLAPLLESEDARTRSYAEHLLFQVALGNSDADSYVIRYLRAHDETESIPLLLLLFERRPDTTVEMFHRWAREERATHEPNHRDLAEDEVIRGVAVVEHARRLWDNGITPQSELVESAQASMQVLIASDVWWGRAYAAGIMNLHPRLRREMNIQPLRDEEHPVVRKLAAKVWR